MDIYEENQVQITDKMSLDEISLVSCENATRPKGAYFILSPCVSMRDIKAVIAGHSHSAAISRPSSTQALAFSARLVTSHCSKVSADCAVARENQATGIT